MRLLPLYFCLWYIMHENICERKTAMKTFFKEFKEFAVKGNVMTLAVGMIIGLAFQSVVSSLTDNIISPIIGIFVGQNFDALEVTVRGATIRYGSFITSVIDFIILALIVFLIVKAMNRLIAGAEKEKEELKADNTK